MRCCAALALLAFVGLSCSDEAEGPLAIEISATSRALLAGLETVRVQLHPGDIECLVLEASGADFEAVYSLPIRVDSMGDSSQGTLFNIVEDQYSVDAWGFDVDGEVAAYGCAGVIMVRDGEKTEVSIALEPR